MFLSGLAFADQVTMKNGDRLSGKIVKYDGKHLILKSEFAGDVNIPWDAVTGISTTEPLNIGLKDGQMVVGEVSTADGKFQVTTKDAGIVTAAKDSVQYIRNKDEQAAYLADIDRYHNPRLVDLWSGFLDLGYATTRGNTETSTFTLSANANRTTSRDKIEAHYTEINSSSNASGPTLTTANAKRGGISYSLNFVPKWFAFGSMDLESDQFQSLDLRFNPAGGLGYHAIKTDRMIFDFQGGVSEDKEFYSTGLDRSFTEVLAGEELNYKLSKAASIHQKLTFFPNMSDTGNYRINFDLAAVTAIKKWFSWQFTVSDRYISNPIAGHKNNDLLLSTGLRVTFAK